MPVFDKLVLKEFCANPCEATIEGVYTAYLNFMRAGGEFIILGHDGENGKPVIACVPGQEGVGDTLPVFTDKEECGTLGEKDQYFTISARKALDNVRIGLFDYIVINLYGDQAFLDQEDAKHLLSQADGK